MSIRKLSQALLSLFLVSFALLSSTAFGQSTPGQRLPFVPSRVTQRVDDTRLVKLQGNTNRMARPQFDKGLVEPSLAMNKMMLVLKRSPEQEAALAAFDERQLDPASPDFHHWLHADEFGQTYGPSDADMASVTGWLEREGFTIDNVSKGRVNIQFSGTAAQVQQAFHVEMHHYFVEGKLHLSNDRDPQIPEALGPVVAGVASLHDFFGYHMSHLGGYVKRDPATGKLTRVYPEKLTAEPTPLLSTYATPATTKPSRPSAGPKPNLVFTDTNGDVVHDLAPADFAAVYDINPTYNAGYNGKGITVAITATSDITNSDVATYRSTFGLPATTVNYIQTDAATDPGLAGPSENTEDLEMVSAAAPGATLDLVISNNSTTTAGYDLSDAYIVDNEVAPIMTVSYGQCELKITTAGNASINSIFQQGATEGITIFIASGDSGAATCERQESGDLTGDSLGLQVSGYASSPYVTAVGGTDFDWSYKDPASQATSYYWNATNGTNFETAKGYVPEIAWNTTCTNPLLLYYFEDGGTPDFTSVEDLCNYVIDNNVETGLVDLGSGGGGYSHCTTNTSTDTSTTWDPTSCSGGYAKPSWQTGTGVPADGKRDVPDIAMFASFGYFVSTANRIPTTEILTCFTDPTIPSTCSSADYTDASTIIYQENGGTSAASPFSAGVMALILQKANGEKQGLANSVFYKLAAKQSTTTCNASTEAAGAASATNNGCYFNDVTKGSNAQNCITGGPECVTNTTGDEAGVLSGYSAGAGYDEATGLGSMNVTNIVNGWPTATGTATLGFSATTLTFASTTVGATTAAQSVTVTNTGTATATLTTIALTGSTDFTKTATTCGTTLAAAASCTVSVDFKPAAAGTATGTISFTDSATGSPQSVALTGTGAAAALTVTVSPTTLTFASTTVGVATAAQVVTVTNTSVSAVTLGTIGFTGTGATSYVKSATTCTTSLAASASCTISVEFDPTAAGSLPASLSIADNATGTPQLVTLTGTGVAAGTGLTITPASLTFAATTVGTSAATQVITLKNATGAAVTFTSTTTITGTGAASFTKSATNCPNPLPAGASCTNTITFKPTVIGALTAVITYTETASATPQTVPFSGTGVAPALTVTVAPSTLTFASTTVGSTTAAQVATVTNTSASAVTLGTIGFTGTGATSYLKSATTCGTSLAASANCTISVEFKPTAAGSLPASLSIADNATGTPQLVALTGTGVAAALTVTVSPTTLTFASTTVGSTTAAQIVTVTNTSVSAVTLGTIGFTGTGATSYLKSATTCTTSLAAAANCTISVEFKPTAAGSLPASLSIADNATGTPQLVALTGSGIAAGTGLTITPASLTFAPTTVGTSAATQVITLKNATAAAVTFTSTTTITGPGAASFTKSATNCPNPLPAGASCTNTITFKPTVVGALTAVITYTETASATPQTVPFSGTGVAPAVPAFTLSATSIAFPATAIGSTSDLQTLTITNSGTVTATLSSIAVTGTNATSFEHLTTCGTTLAASATCSVYVSFKPTAAGALTGAVTLTDNATGSPQTVTLTGTGTAVPALKLSATTLTFATEKVGSTAALQTVTLTNSGTAVLELDSITLAGTNATSFLALNTCSATLAAGATCTVYVGFTPTVTGALTGTLTIVSNGSGSPQAVTLTGTGD